MMEPIPWRRMTGICCRLWRCQMARMRTIPPLPLVLGVNLVSALCRASGADIALVSISRSTEDFSYFTLRRNATATEPATSLFGISCTRQIDASSLIKRPPDVTRSTVQKAVVVVTDSPQHFGQLREKLSIVTSAWFAQRYVYLQQ